MRKFGGVVLLLVAVGLLAFLATKLVGPNGLRRGTDPDRGNTSSDSSAQDAAYSTPAAPSQTSRDLTRLPEISNAGASGDQFASRHTTNPNGEGSGIRADSARTSANGNDSGKALGESSPGGLAAAGSNGVHDAPAAPSTHDGNSQIGRDGSTAGNAGGSSSANPAGGGSATHVASSADQGGNAASTTRGDSASGDGSGSAFNPDSTTIGSSDAPVPQSGTGSEHGAAAGSGTPEFGGKQALTDPGTTAAGVTPHDPTAYGGSAFDVSTMPGPPTTTLGGGFPSGGTGGAGLGGGSAAGQSGSGSGSGHVPGDSFTVPGGYPFTVPGDSAHGLDAGGSGGSHGADSPSVPNPQSNGAGAEGTSNGGENRDVPEPSLMLMLGAGFTSVMARRSRKR